LNILHGSNLNNAEKKIKKKQPRNESAGCGKGMGRKDDNVIFFLQFMPEGLHFAKLHL